MANKLVVYNSSYSFGIEEINTYLDGPLAKNKAFEKYSNADYEAVCEKKLDTSKFSVDPIRKMHVKLNPGIELKNSVVEPNDLEEPDVSLGEQNIKVDHDFKI